MIFYDFEVFKTYWCVCICDLINEEIKIIDTRDELLKLYEQHKDDVWIGYNSRNYDQFILKGILLGMNPKEINDFIIKIGNKGWGYSRAFSQLQLYNYDIYKTNDRGLKFLEGSMGNDIQESSVAFDLERELTEDEKQEVWHYCQHDVEQTVEVFIQRINDFNAHMDVIKNFNLPLSYISKTQAQLSAIVLECSKHERHDEWDIQLVNTLRIKKYWHVVEWFKNPNNYDSEASLVVNVANVPHQFGWGGLHGAPEEPLHATGLILHVDVTSFYPSIMIEYGLLTRNAKDPNKYKDIYKKRVELKKQGKKKEQAPYKIILNSTYGISNDKYSHAYDPRQARNVCANGQLLLLDLIEHLEAVPSFELIQSNTDGLIIRIAEEDFDLTDDICYEWEQRTHMGLGFDYIEEIYQKDVNNYLFIQEDGEVERKGAYLKPLSNLNYDLPIINKAMVEFFVNKTPVETTINNCDDLKEFQMIKKISNKYLHIKHGDKTLNERTIRCFASLRQRDGGLFKKHAETETYVKIEGTPEHAFIYNGNVNNKKAPRYLDKQWYIDVANKRLLDFGRK